MSFNDGEWDLIQQEGSEGMRGGGDGHWEWGWLHSFWDPPGWSQNGCRKNILRMNQTKGVMFEIELGEC